jgi:hypothetical protein
MILNRIHHVLGTQVPAPLSKTKLSLFSAPEMTGGPRRLENQA